MRKLYNYQKTLLAGGIIIIAGSACKFMTLFNSNKLLDVVFGISIIIFSILLAYSNYSRKKENPNIEHNNFKFKKAPRHVQVFFVLASVIALVILILSAVFVFEYYS